MQRFATLCPAGDFPAKYGLSFDDAFRLAFEGGRGRAVPVLHEHGSFVAVCADWRRTFPSVLRQCRENPWAPEPAPGFALPASKIASILGLSFSQMLALANTGSLPEGVPLGGRVYFERTEIADWAHKHLLPIRGGYING